ncbi:MAG: prolipoprotein diacylglyceryl transferase family protein, partial [Bacteroidota bacterium]
MLELLLSIDWTVDPEIFQMNKPLEIGDFKIGPIKLRWYGLLFASGFLVCLEIGKRMFKKEGVPETWLESAFIWIFLGTVIGARLGHVFFYEMPENPQHFIDHPLDIFAFWRGGMASHGGFFGMTLAFYLFARYFSKRSIFWA